MAEVVSCWPLTAQAWVQSDSSPRGICGGESGTGTDFCLSASVFPCQYHSTNAQCSFIHQSQTP
jgi:hypothetical protein